MAQGKGGGQKGVAKRLAARKGRGRGLHTKRSKGANHVQQKGACNGCNDVQPVLQTKAMRSRNGKPVLTQEGLGAQRRVGLGMDYSWDQRR